MEIEASVESEDYMRGTPTLRIPLTQGKFALIDTTDWRLIAGTSWYARRGNPRTDVFYAVPTKGKKRQPMHELLLGRKWVDHRNGNGLDNRRQNLRPVTHAQNQVNRGANRGHDTFKGVQRMKNGTYRAVLGRKGGNLHLGMFTDEVQAALAYDRAAVQHHGEFARLNFPKEQT